MGRDGQIDKALLGSLPVAVAVCVIVYKKNGDPHGYRFEYANRSFLKIVGLSSSEIVGSSPRSIKGLAGQVSSWHGVAGTRKKSSFKARLGKTQFLYECSVSSPRRTQLVLTLVRSPDVPDQVEHGTEMPLNSADQRFRDIVENINDVIFTVSPGGRIIYVSPVGEDLFEFSCEEIVGKKFLEIVHEDDRPRMRERFKELLQGVMKPAEYRLVTRSGKVRWVESFSRPYYENGQLLEIRGSLRDITDSRRAEWGMELGKEIAANASPGILAYRASGECIFTNDAAAEITGFTREELMRESFREIPGLKEAGLLEEANDVLATGETRQIEVDLTTTRGKRLCLDCRLVSFKFRNEVTLMFMFEDIAERKLIHDALSKSEERYRTLFESARDGILVVKDRHFVDCNPAACELFGCERVEIIGKRPEDLSPELQADGTPSGEMSVQRLNSTSALGPQFFDWTHMRPDGSLFDVEVSLSTFVSTADGDIMIAHLRDSTERKAAQIALKRSEETARVLLDAPPDVALLLGTEGTILALNDRAARTIGEDRKELVGKCVFDFADADVAELRRKKLAEVVRSKAPLQYEEKSGERWYLTGAFPVLSDDGEVEQIAAFARDITDARKAEENLAEARALLQAAIEQTPSGVIIADAPDVKIRMANAAALSMRGESDVSLLNISMQDHSKNWQVFRLDGSPFDPERLPLSRAILKGETVKNEEVLIRDSEGKDHNILINAAPIRGMDGEITAGIAMFSDITEWRRLAVDLERSEERNVGLMHNAPMGIHVYDLNESEELILTYSNPAADMITADDNSERWGLTIEQAFPPLADTDIPSAYRAVALTGEPWHTDQIIYEDESITGAFDVNAFRTSERQVTVMFENITARKLAEQRIKESEERLAILFESAPDAIYLADRTSKFVDGNKAAEEMIGYKRKELIGKRFMELGLLPRRLLPRAAASLARNLLGRPAGPEIYTLNRRDGSQVEAEIRTFPVKIRGETLLLGIARDITERLRSQNEVRKREAELGSIFRASPIGIGLVVNRVFIRVNDKVCEMTGYSENELLGESARMLYSTQEDFDYVGSEKYKQVGEHGTGTVETRWKRHDGTMIDVLLSSTPLDTEDLSEGVTFTALDITERKATERMLQRTQFSVDNSADAIFWLDESGHFCYVNDSTCSVSGVPEG